MDAHSKTIVAFDAAKNGADRVAMYFSALLLIVLYAFLYAPIAYIAFVSVSANTAWPFPVNFSLEGFRLLLGGRAYQEALWNSLIIGFGTALISTVLATLGAIAVLKYDSRFRYLVDERQVAVEGAAAEFVVL